MNLITKAVLDNKSYPQGNKKPMSIKTWVKG